MDLVDLVDLRYTGQHNTDFEEIAKPHDLGNGDCVVLLLLVSSLTSVIHNPDPDFFCAICMDGGVRETFDRPELKYRTPGA